MLCSEPFQLGHIEGPCGRCEPCKLNRRRLWSTRILLEAGSNRTGLNLFVTLTYDDEHLPSDWSVDPRRMRYFLDTFRKACNFRVRYFLVGEYGDETYRPHYHLVLFLDSLDLARVCQLLEQSWKLGFVKVDPLSIERAMYICGYALKKWTSQDSIDKVKALVGRRPEFVRMSNRPGIGALACEDLLRIWKGVEGTVPSVVRLQGSYMPLGRYLKNVMKDYIGMTPSERQLENMTAALAFRLAHPDIESESNYRERRGAQRVADRGKARVAFIRSNQRKKGSL